MAVPSRLSNLQSFSPQQQMSWSKEYNNFHPFLFKQPGATDLQMAAIPTQLLSLVS